MSQITAVVIDDDFYTRDQLEQLLKKFFPEIQLVASCVNGAQGLRAITTHHPEIVFLDIELPDMSGFQMLEQLKQVNFEIIFITSFNQYAIKAIRFSALDYLLKPIQIDELRSAINRFKNKTIIDSQKRIGNFLHNYKMQPKHFRLAINTTEGTHLLNTDDIIRCEGDVNYTRFFMHLKAPVLASKTLKEYDELLSDHQFIRVHRAHLVNRKYVTAITPDHKLKMQDGSTVDISKRKFSEVKELLSLS
ncbi:MAG: LytTR family DNA-binding domain-containing protein [Chitinophagales bacterium]